MATTPTAAFDIARLFGVADKTVVITGGGSGIGSYMALGFALNGARVYVVGRRKESLEKTQQDFEERKASSDAPAAAKSGKIIPLQGDVTSKESIQALADAFGKHEKSLDVLINNAGMGKPLPFQCDKDDADQMAKSLWSEEWDSWSNTLGLNVTAVHFTSVAFYDYLRKAEASSMNTPGPCIINTASIAAGHVSRMGPLAPSYNVSKAATEKVTKMLAARFIGARIRVNSIAPGLFPSEINAPTPEGLMEMFPNLPQMVPLGRSGTPDEIAALAIFLASRGGGYCNGGSFTIDGGRLLLVAA